MRKLMNGRSETVECDGKALKGIFYAKNFNAKMVEEKLEYAPGYFSKVFNRNRIGIKCVMMLDAKFGISPASYNVQMPLSAEQSADTAEKTPKEKVLEKKEKRITEPTITLQVQLDAGQLKQIIEAAVMEAFEKL